MNLVEIFNRTMEQCDTDEELIDTVRASVREQSVNFEKDSVPAVAPRFTEPVRQQLSSKRSFEAARSYAEQGKRVAVLNFASFVTPGGGVTRGAKAQEESLCRISTLYPALISDTAKPFYQAHHEAIEAGVSTRRNNDDCIYTPGVKVICEDNFDCTPLDAKERYTVDVITCAAQDQRYAGEYTFRQTEDELYEAVLRRICRTFSVCALRQADVLIMGAFGCGVFHNSPAVVARAFETATGRFKTHFSVIEYAIANRFGDSENYNAFKQIGGIVCS